MGVNLGITDFEGQRAESGPVQLAVQEFVGFFFFLFCRELIIYYCFVVISSPLFHFS